MLLSPIKTSPLHFADLVGGGAYTTIGKSTPTENSTKCPIGAGFRISAFRLRFTVLRLRPVGGVAARRPDEPEHSPRSKPHFWRIGPAHQTLKIPYFMRVGRQPCLSGTSFQEVTS
jgi:hypothetical protein